MKAVERPASPAQCAGLLQAVAIGAVADECQRRRGHGKRPSRKGVLAVDGHAQVEGVKCRQLDVVRFDAALFGSARAERRKRKVSSRNRSRARALAH